MIAGSIAAPSRTVLLRASVITVTLALVFFLSSHLGTFWITSGRTSSPIFPGTGAALAALLLAGRRYWPAVVASRLLAFWIASSTQPPVVWLAVAAANGLAAWTGAYVLERFGRVDLGMARLRDVLWLGVGALGSSIVGATIGALALTITGGALAAPFSVTWTTWWMGSVGGILVVTPLILAWGTGDPLPRSLTYWLHLLACVAATSAVSALVFFGPASALSRSWLVFPVLLWCSLVFGVRGATLALLPATIIGVAGTMMGTGVLAGSAQADSRFVILQQFVIAASFTALVLAVVADERRGKLALRDREHRLHLALAAARSFAYEHDLASDQVTRTAECAEILGWPLAQAQRSTIQAFVEHVDTQDQALFADVLTALSAHQPTCRLAYRFNRPDGRTLYLEDTCTGAYDEAGALTRVVGVAVDVTERRQAELERESLLDRERTARQEAERATLLRDEFLGTVSHELRTPLNAILGWAQILQSGPRTADALQSGLATIARNARLQTQLIDDLLDLSRMSAGQLRVGAQPVDLATVVHDAVVTVMPAAAAKGQLLHHDDTETGLYVSGDADRLQQVCWNLLVNAVKFTPPGGHIHITLHRDDGVHVVTVSDSGQGIGPDFLPHVFERFRQGDGSTTRRHSGLGIGLALVRQLVELHGGSVSADSRGAGLGATFVVRLPAHHALASLDAATPIAALPVDDGLTPSLTVLVVDDDADSREVAVRFLETSGARVLAAAGADEGLEILQAQRPDVLVADIGMPGVDGYALIRAVRALRPDQGAATPAAAVTALTRDDDRQRAFDAGYQAHLPKPITRDALIATVSRLHRSRNPA
ncbi:MAG TPA: ATP-binding protein [Luteitalea sp.]|nr:ATP-binding protein [Luteitalea sp.]